MLVEWLYACVVVKAAMREHTLVYAWSTTHALSSSHLFAMPRSAQQAANIMRRPRPSARTEKHTRNTILRPTINIPNSQSTTRHM